MHSSPSSCTTTIIILVFIAISTCYSQYEEQYYDCISNFTCGENIQNISYPFWGGGNRPQFCGQPAFELKCQNNEFPTIDINDRPYRVLRINQSNHVMTVAGLDLWNDRCTQELHNITFESNIFSPGPMNRDLSIFYNCTPEITRAFPNNFTCERGGSESLGFYADESFVRVNLENSRLSTILCSESVKVPVLRVTLDELSNGSLKLQQGLKRGFEVIYNAKNEACSLCEGSGGLCGSNSSELEFVCHCRDRTDPTTCQSSGDEWNVSRKLAIGFGASGFTLLVVGLFTFLYKRRHKKRYGASSWISRKFYPSSMSDLEQPGAFYGVHIFKYSELEKATSNFDSEKELGDGGFGTVYKGKLKDGRIVAVKRLYEHNYKRMEQFMNEVEILARLRHQNLVSLYGCTSRHCHELLLVYEYISNGTVADHLHGCRAKPGSLSWTTRMSIAVETATALAYLHASDVIHRDVKTNNILLDSNFCVKVADFGLSRLFPVDVTHVSTAPQGTPGYVDPEYHECYQLTVKSDVYSFGVVLIELISSKPAVDIMRHRHEINLSSMAINKIQNHELHELVDPSLGFGSDYKVREMITEVAELAFLCLQSKRDMRPSMETVLVTLKGIQSGDWNMKKAEEVEIPADEMVLLQSDPPTLSTDSMAESPISRGITPNGNT